MKSLLAALLLLPCLAFADDSCPVLTGVYACESVLLEGATYIAKIEIVTDGNQYTISSITDPSIPVSVVIANGDAHSTTAPALEGTIVEYQRVACRAGKLEANFRTSWFHEGHIDEREVPAIDEVLNQWYSLDKDGNLVEEQHRTRLYLGNDRHPSPQTTSRTCTKTTK